MENQLAKIFTFIDEHKEDMVQDLRTFADLEGHFEEKDNVLKARTWLQQQLEKEGFACRFREVADDRCGIMIAELGMDRPGKPIIFSGHCDTVHYTGSFGGENPTVIKDGKFFGPGVLDMKGGLIIALYVAKALNFIQYKEHPIKLIVVGEEESDHVGNDGNKILTAESKGALCCFNMETGQMNNSLCTQKKSQFTYYLSVDGVGGHAGNDFLKGRNAINEAVYKIQKIIELTDLSVGTTVTTAVIKGGGHTSGIADHCEVVFDVRVTNENEAKRIMDSMYEITDETFIEGTKSKLTYYRAKLLPLQETKEAIRLLDFVNTVAKDNGFDEFGKVHLGGASDAGNMAAAGIPVLDNCGIIGQYAHNKKEYGIINSLYSRAKIFAGTVLKIKEL
ncbi:M20/M25/M40 family metallo-hydrolase [uncultured Veillonella sp.]|uniref:M20/M25/M40 family metallo-hydrolase n=1 Tax=uncultured Veillonella sp. TaxID=159268 RepID=UPI002673A974|nr:M20/M25/M40 family metallo-hydrolase [uncultured Veillonella sp.]